MDKFPHEFVEPFKFSFSLLRRCNITLYEERGSFLQRNWRYLLIAPAALIFYVCSGAYFCKVFSGGLDFLQLAYIVPVFVVCTQGFIKFATVIVYKVELRSVVDEMGSMWRMHDLSETQADKKYDCLKHLGLSLRILYWLNIFGTWQYILVPFFETLFRMVVLEQDTRFIFPFYCVYPFDRSANWFIYISVYAFEAYAILRMIYPYLGVEFLMLTLCGHLSTEFALLNEDLKNAIPDNSPVQDDVIQNYEERKPYSVRDVVIRHQKLIKLSSKLDKFFNKMIFVNLVFATVTICMFGFVSKIARTPTDIVNNFVGVVASMLPIFTLCYYGQLLSTESIALSDSAYQNLWYHGGTNYKKTICIIMKRSQKPCSLTSLRYAPITLNTFTTVISTTWSYFSLANTMYNRF